MVGSRDRDQHASRMKRQYHQMIRGLDSSLSVQLLKPTGHFPSVPMGPGARREPPRAPLIRAIPLCLVAVGRRMARRNGLRCSSHQSFPVGPDHHHHTNRDLASHHTMEVAADRPFRSSRCQLGRRWGMKSVRKVMSRQNLVSTAVDKGSG